VDEEPLLRLELNLSNRVDPTEELEPLLKECARELRTELEWSEDAEDDEE